VTVYNRTAAKADAWVSQHGGQTAATPRAAAEGADIVFACVGNDDDVRSITLCADGAFDGMGAGAIFIDNTTASADLARELYKESGDRGFGFLDAPVSGGQAGAENDRLLRARVRAHRRGGQRPAGQDGQPDLHRRRRAGPV
jgi:3-hydroxyisobutyrate dehydrogenase-like beta-hydroxyacid dehydrogenase